MRTKFSFAVPTIFARSDLERLISPALFNLPGFLYFSSKMRRLIASLSLTDLVDRVEILFMNRLNSRA